MQKVLRKTDNFEVFVYITYILVRTDKTNIILLVCTYIENNIHYI